MCVHIHVCTHTDTLRRLLVSKLLAHELDMPTATALPMEGKLYSLKTLEQEANDVYPSHVLRQPYFTCKKKKSFLKKVIHKYKWTYKKITLQNVHQLVFGPMMNLVGHEKIFRLC